MTIVKYDESLNFQLKENVFQGEYTEEKERLLPASTYQGNSVKRKDVPSKTK